MGLVSSRSNNAEAQDLRHNFGGFTGAFHPMVGKLVGGQALGVKRAETGLVSEQRPAGHGQAPGEQNLDGGIEPKNGDTGRAQKLGAAGLRVGAATERQDRSLLKLASAADCRAKLVRFELAEECLAEALEDLRDGEAARLFDALVEIDKAPRELPREERTNGSLAGTHEAGERNNRHAGSKAARSRCSCHAKEARGA
jgi:hypothetical protein